MNHTKQTRPDNIPSFSIILETENLAINDPEKLINCIQTLESQSLSPTFANEVLVVQSGDIPPSVLTTLKQQFPWVKVINVDEAAGYYEAKMELVSTVTGDIIVFCDSDCAYVSDWLESMLMPFRQDDKANVVTGETSIVAGGPYTFAMSLSWLFPPYSNKKMIYETSGYAANNVAFRRQFLLKHPIPCDLDIIRGNCTIHAQQIRNLGQIIWKQPKARASHPYPKVSQFFLRFFVIGHNKLMCYRLAENSETKNWLYSSLRDIYYAVAVISRQLVIPFYRLPTALIGKPEALIYLPVSVIIVMGTTLGFILGVIISIIRPQLRLTEFASKLDFD